MDGEKKKSDRRVIKTKRAIRNAFIALLARKDFNEISIKDIADEADVDRKTVYNYYGGTYEIRDELENEIISLMDEATEKLDFQNHLANPRRIFDILTEIINGNIDLYSALIKIDAKSYTFRKLSVMLTARVRAGLEKSPLAHNDSSTLDYIAEFITSGMLSVYQNWFNSDRSKPLETLSKEVGSLVLYGIKSLEK